MCNRGILQCCKCLGIGVCQFIIHEMKAGHLTNTIIQYFEKKQLSATFFGVGVDWYKVGTVKTKRSGLNRDKEFPLS